MNVRIRTRVRTVVAAKLTVEKQFEEEIGTGIFVPFSLPNFLQRRKDNFTTHQEELDFMLRMKYGLEAPILNDKELRAIHLEERKTRKFEKFRKA